jgi:hypothetical protein
MIVVVSLRMETAALTGYPRMVDFSKVVRVTVNGEPRFEGKVEPSLGTALESYERRRDWGMVYPAKITLDLKP